MWLIYKKEIMELLRDKKTLIFTILLPTLILPILLGGFAYFSVMMAKKSASEVLTYTTIGEEFAPFLVDRLRETEGFEKKDVISKQEITTAIRAGDLKFVLVIPEGIDRKIEQLKPVQVELHYNAASATSRVFSRVNEIVGEYNTHIQTIHLERLGVDKQSLDALLKPVSLEKKSIAKAREKFGEVAGGIAAYFLLIITLSGAIYPALDLGVGEKERQTLETLLLNPIPRWQMVLAKFWVIFTTGFLAVFLSIFSMTVWAVIAGQAMAVQKIGEVLSMISMADLGMMLMMLVPTAAMFASILLSISIYARNFKEAQNYISPLMMVVIMPVMAAMIPGMELTWTTSLIPLTNIALSMKEILKGTMDYSMIFAILASTTVLAGALLWFCTQWFKRESVLFRS